MSDCDCGEFAHRLSCSGSPVRIVTTPKDETTPTCQRYLCRKRTAAVTSVVTKRGEVWIVSTCSEHNPRRPDRS